MPVQAKNTVQQLSPESVHYRHNDDQRCDAEHDAEQGKPGDDGDEAFLALSSQVAERHRPFEGGKHGASRIFG